MGGRLEYWASPGMTYYFTARSLSRLHITCAMSLVALFSMLCASRLELSADGIYIYSFAKDLVDGIPLTGWQTPPSPYFFPDIFLSIPLLALHINPLTWFYLASTLQPMLFVLLMARHTRVSAEPFAAALTRSAILFIAGYALFYILGKTTWNVTASVFFMLGHHMFPALVALGLYWSMESNARSFRYYMLAVILGFVTGLSDPFFLPVFAMLALAHLLVHKRLAEIGYTGWVAASAALGIFINYRTNIALTIQAANNSGIPYDIMGNAVHFYHVVHARGLIFLLAVPCLAICHYFTRRNRADDQQLVLGVASLLLIALMALSGVVRDIFQMRYLCALAPVYLYLAALSAMHFSLLDTLLERWKISLMYGLTVIMAIGAFASPYKNPLSDPHRKLMDCAEITPLRDKPFLSEYWAAKILFEMRNRDLSMTQVTSDLTNYAWIFNSSWPSMVSSGRKSDSFVLLTLQISPRIMASLTPAVRASYCDGLAVEIDCHKARAALTSPVLTGICL
jgi:hypothetical protein